MSSATLVPAVFIITGIILIGWAYLVGIKKKVNLISGVDSEKLKKVKNVDKLAKDYSKALVLLAFSCFTAAILLLYLGNFGKIIGIIVILISAVNLSRVSLNVEIKSYKKK